MAPGKTRSTRRLRGWIVQQVDSEKYPGLVWDDDDKTMFRIPWKHAGKQDFRSNEDAAIFKAWAVYKGKLTETNRGREDPASWKTRLRCALNKSPEFEEMQERSQLDISEPYKVYRLVPVNEQAGLCDKIKGVKERPGRRKRKISESDSEEEKPMVMKEEVIIPVPINMCVQNIQAVTDQSESYVPPVVTMKDDSTVDEIQLNFRIETVPPSEADHSFHVSVCYMGTEVLQRDIMGNDVRIAYLPTLLTPPTPHALTPGGFPRILLPEVSSIQPNSPTAVGGLQALSSLLPYMEKGVVLTVNGSGVYAKRFCLGRVYWTGPHTSTPGVHKMERNVDPVLLFSKDIFRQELANFSAGGPTPKCGVTLCFGEELSDAEDPTGKLITSRITFPWAIRQIEQAHAFMESIAILKNMANQSPLGEVTLNLVAVPPDDQSQELGTGA